MCGQICDGTLMPGTGRSWRTRVLHLGMIMREALVGSTAGLDLMATTGQLNRPSLLPVVCLHAFALAHSCHVGVVGVAGFLFALCILSTTSRHPFPHPWTTQTTYAIESEAPVYVIRSQIAWVRCVV